MHIGLGETLSILSAAAWAVGVILYRQLVRDLPPMTLGLLKNSLVLLMLLPVLPLVPVLHGGGLPAMSLQEVALALGSGLLGIALADTLYFTALARLGAGRMGVIGNSYSPLVILLSVVFLGERLGLWQMAGFVLVMAGVMVIARRPATAAGHDGHTSLPLAPRPMLPAEITAAPAPTPHLTAVLLGLGSIALMAVAIVMIKPVLEAQPLGWVTLLRLIGAIGGLLLIAALRGQLRQLLPGGRRVDWKLLLAAAFIGQFLSMLLWLGGYKYTLASIAAILNETASIFIVLMAWLWLREPLGLRGALGVSLTLGGVVLMLAV